MKFKIRKLATLVASFLVLSSVLFMQNYAAAQEVPKKEIAKHGDWNVNVNYLDPSNPMCQIYTDMVSPDYKHGGLLTLWREFKSKTLRNNITIEATIFNVGENGLERLSDVFKHKFGNDVGATQGITREQQGQLIFSLNKDNFNKLLSSKEGVLVVKSQNFQGEAFFVIASMDGINEALAECKMLD